MRQSRFADGQFIGIIKEQEAGLTTAAPRRKRGSSPMANAAPGLCPDPLSHMHACAAGQRMKP